MKNYLLPFLVLLLLTNCHRLPKQDKTPDTERILLAKGTEDLVLDSLSGAKRLLISCNDHRMREKADNGNIYSYDLNSAEAKPLPRLNEPQDMEFHPHGIHLAMDQRLKAPCLYVVSHDDSTDQHPIYKYRIYQDSLVFLQAYEHEAIYSPNAVTAFGHGGFFISNDLGKRNNRIEAALKIKKGNIVYCDASGNCRRVAEGLSYANGILLSPDEQYLYIATTSENKIYRYKIGVHGALWQKELVAEVFGTDNLRWGTDGMLYTAGHYNFLAFAQHAKKQEKPSPSVIFKIDPLKGTKELLYLSKGSEISAAAVALEEEGNLYIGQVFGDFILKVKLQD
jgi:arylesterase/paraoxonase